MSVGSHTKQSGSATVVREPETLAPHLSSPAQPGKDPAGGTHALRGFKQVQRYAVGRIQERRAYGRVRLALSLRITRVAGQRGGQRRCLQTSDISSSGVYFLSPRRIEPGTPIQLEVLIVDRPIGGGTVRMRTEAHVVRTEEGSRSGWYGMAAAFDDISFLRGGPPPVRPQKS